METVHYYEFEKPFTRTWLPCELLIWQFNDARTVLYTKPDISSSQQVQPIMDQFFKSISMTFGKQISKIIYIAWEQTHTFFIIYVDFVLLAIREPVCSRRDKSV